jgi:hypothetical protein
MNTIRTLILAFSAVCFTVSQAQWQPFLSGLSSVRSITTQDADIYAVSYPTGIFKSDNDGATWTPAINGITLSSGNAFVRSVGRNTTHLFAGTHTGIYRSNNGGTNWTLANGSLTASGTIYANKFFQFGNTTFAVFSGTIANGGGIQRTVDNGNTWLIGHSGMGSNATVYQMATSGTALYAATSVGIYKSTDNGQQWTLLSGSNFAVYAIQAVNGRLIVISTFGYRYSVNDGANWTNATGAVASPTKGELIAYDGKLYAITGTNTGALVSTDNGSSYTAFNDGLAPIDVVSQEQFHATGSRLFLGAFSDLYSVPGSTVGVAEDRTTVAVPVYPTVFNTDFTVDLSSLNGHSTVLLLDAGGREVLRKEEVTANKMIIARSGLATGRYTVVVMQHGSAIHHSPVIAQ